MESVKPVLKWSWKYHFWRVRRRGGFDRLQQGQAIRPPRVCPRCGGSERCSERYPHYCWNCIDEAGRAVQKIARRAIQMVGFAVKVGRLPKLDGSIICVDCLEKPARVYEHRDYSKPLEVDPVCRGCNARRGPARDVAHLWVKALPKRAP